MTLAIGSETSAGAVQPGAPSHPQLIRDYRQRMDRHEQKTLLALRLLRDETWSSVAVLASCLEVSYSSAHRLVKALAQDGLVSQETFTVRGTRGVRNVVLVGITHHGLAHAWGLDEVVQSRAVWEPSKTNPLFVPHTLEVQEARIAAMALGWTDWVPGRLLASRGLAKVPDATVISPAGERVAVELERHIKSQKRYESVLGAYVSAMKKSNHDTSSQAHGTQTIARVDYLCPSADMAARLARTMGLVKHLRFEGQGKEPTRVAPLSQEHLDRFRFFGAKDWPDGPWVRARLNQTGEPKP